MANHASARKRARQAAKREARNRHIRSTMRTYVKRARQAVSEGGATQEPVKAAISRIERAVSKGILHRKTASRLVSRLSRQAARQA